MPSDIPVPAPLGGIRNAAWLTPFSLWRGEQPPSDDATVQALQQCGINVIFSLRTDGELAGPVAGRHCPAYSLDDERTQWEGRGFEYRHVRFTDFAALPPSELASALRVLDADVDAGKTVFVHCRAGVGRTGLLTGAWLMTRGHSGDDAGAHFLQFSEDIFRRSTEAAHAEHAEAVPTREQYWRRVGFRHQWWALLQIAEALGSPIQGQFLVPEPERPEEAEGWEARYREELAPWRRR